MVASAGMFRSLRVRNYRLYTSGQVVSLTGTWMQRVAQDWLVLELSGSATAVGVVLALQFGPTLLFSLFGGVLADRYDKRRILLVTQSVMIVQALALGLLDVSGHAQLWHVYALAAVLGVTSALDVPVRQSFVVEMVGPGDLPNAVGLNSVTFNLARIVGPSLAGLLIAAAGTGWVFLGNAVFTIAVILSLAAMRPAELFRSPPAGRSPGQLREGLRYVRSRPELMLPMALVFVVGTFGMNFPVTLALLAKEVFGRGAAAYGLFSTAIAVGSVCGALVASRRAGRPRPRVLLLGAFAFGTLEALVGVMPTYWSVVVLLVPTGAAALTFTIAANSTVQLGSDPGFRGRVMALYLMCFLGGTPLGAPLVGVVSDVLGPRAGIVGSGAVCAVAAVVAAVWVARRRGPAVPDGPPAGHHPDPSPNPPPDPGPAPAGSGVSEGGGAVGGGGGVGGGPARRVAPAGGATRAPHPRRRPRTPIGTAPR